MTILQGFLLGILQGIAEFLPISSSGHLKVVQYLFGLEEVPLLYDVFLHLATLLAVIIFFRKQIWELLCAFGTLFVSKKKKAEFSPEKMNNYKNNKKYILAIIISTIVTAVLGLVTSKLLEDDKISIKITCAGFIVTALILVVSSLIDKYVYSKKELPQTEIPNDKVSPTWWQALIIGLAQGIGTLPGISRSGSTIAGSLFCGVNRAQAGVYSFIISIPAILGAFILEVKDLGEVSSSIGFAPVAIGCVSAFISGYAALTLLMKLIKNGKLQWFAAYLIPLGILGMIFFN